MNRTVKRALEALPVAIKVFDAAVINYVKWVMPKDTQFIQDNGYSWTHLSHLGEESLSRSDLAELLEHYWRVGIITMSQLEALEVQLKSPDRESWYLAFIFIDNLKHNLNPKPYKEDEH